MKAMLAGFALIAVIAVVADLTLDQVGFAADEKLAGDDVRLD